LIASTWEVERHQGRDALRVRRDRRDLEASVARRDRLDPVATVRGDVVGGHHAAGRLDGPRDLLADRPAVVGVAASFGDRAQGRGEVRLAERRPRLAGRREHRAGRIVEGRQRGRDRLGGDPGQLVTLVGGSRGGRERIREGAPAESVEQLGPGVHRSGDVDRQGAALRHRFVAGRSNHLDRQPVGGSAAAVEAMKPGLLGLPHEGKGVAAEPAGVAVHDREHRVRRHGRVDCRAARAQRIDSGRGGRGVGRDDHPMRGGGEGHGREGSRIDAGLDGPTILRAT
jgi:hypothetical protein